MGSNSQPELEVGDIAVYKKTLKCRVMRVNYSRSSRLSRRIHSVLVNFGTGVPLQTINVSELEKFVEVGE